ncbi:hypothetical protein CGMCC3_g3024 [Colletotrichum fructicola]|nr:uncharacterized protein CGMCC3_g3024 [Colletotrichum fructicola]KAE9580879.1 hypothetical protein CGMCC3_g3024 [Colletotrichum fructicola]
MPASTRSSRLELDSGSTEIDNDNPNPPETPEPLPDASPLEPYLELFIGDFSNQRIRST